MRIDRGLHLVMSGGGGFDLTDAFDCNVFLVGSGEEWLMFDAGAGRDPAAVAAILAEDGIDPKAIRHLFLTHGHADHSGGAAYWRGLAGFTVHAGEQTARLVSSGDEDGISLGRARVAGVYPMDYVYSPCPVDNIVVPGEPIRIGDVSVLPIATPGHSRDHISYLVETPSRRMLLGGDALFHGGKVAIQDIEDCDVSAYCRTIRTLAAIDFDALLPGHLTFSLKDGHRHAKAALAYVEALHIPPSIIWKRWRRQPSRMPPKIIAERPPSTVTVDPVMKPARSSAR